jgi:hypothetical protein
MFHGGGYESWEFHVYGVLGKACRFLQMWFLVVYVKLGQIFLVKQEESGGAVAYL